jgi:putative oxidoreductase
MTSAFLLGRIIFGGYWIMSGVNHFTHLRTMVLGIYPTTGSLLLIAFLLAASFMIHKYWEMDTVHARQDEKINFDKNMALVGALLMFVQLPHPWPHSLGM